MDESFRVLCRKDIYEFLEGSGDNQLVEYNGKIYGLPYSDNKSGQEGEWR